MNRRLNGLLANYGYNLIALPKTGIEPLALLYKQNGSLGQVGTPIMKLFDMKGRITPEITENIKVIDISDSISLMTDTKAGLQLMGGLIQLPSTVRADAEVMLYSNDKILVNYQNVREDNINLAQLDTFLQSGLPLGDEFRTFKEKLYNSELYVISAVLKSNRFTVSVADESAQQAKVEVSIPVMAEVTTDISRNKEKKVLLQYNGDVDLVFAFKAQRIIYDHHRWWQLWDKGPAGFRIKDVQNETLKGPEDFPTFPLEVAQGPLDI